MIASLQALVGDISLSWMWKLTKFLLGSGVDDQEIIRVNVLRPPLD
jgi:hypothetical protein